jgi:hypothetical protein
MNKATPQTRLERILDALGAEVAAATDEEVLAAADDLGMKPSMKGTVAFLGLKQFVAPYAPEDYAGPNEDADGEPGSDRKTRPARDAPD